MSAGKAIFVSGLVIGATTGFSVGHLTLWNRCARPLQNAASSEADSSIANTTSAISDLDPWDPLNSFAPSSDLYYAPAADIRDSGEADSRPIDVSAADDELTPPSLLPTPEASPLGVGIEFDLRAAIEREVPDATPEQLEVWVDVLQGLNEEDAVGILRMWQIHGGQLPPSATAELGPLDRAPPELDFGHDVSAPQHSDPGPSNCDDVGIEAFAQLREITLHNIANAQTPGYRALVPVVSNLGFQTVIAREAGERGIRLERIALSINEGPLIVTGEQWDVAIRHHPSVFFKLGNEGEIALTRYGHFELDDQRRLCIAGNGRLWPLDPSVMLPPQAAIVRIESDGRVLARTPDAEFSEVGRIEPCQIHSPQSLETMGDRLYRVTDSRSISSPTEPYELAQGHIEGSNVKLSVERDRLAWLDELSLSRP